MANFPSVTAAGAFESPAVQAAIKTLAEQAVAARLATLEYSSGRRRFTGLLSGVESGDLFALRTGRTVSLVFDTLKLKPGTGSSFSFGNVIPAGFRISGDREFLELSQPAGTGAATGPIRLRPTGELLIYGVYTEGLGAPMYGTVTYQTLEAPPASPPGSAA